MAQYSVFDELQLSLPDDFREMTAEEISKLNPVGEGDVASFKAEERHIIFSVGRKPIGGLAGKLLGPDKLKSALETQIRKAMAPFDYAEDIQLTRSVGGEEAGGIRYRYKVQGVGMTAESLVLKRPHSVYYFHAYVRTESEDESLRLFGEALETAAW